MEVADSLNSQAKVTATPKHSRSLWALVLLGVGLVVATSGGLWSDRFAPPPDPLRPVTGLRWWFTPVERNAFLRLPAVQGTLFGISAVDAKTIWAVGAHGLIVGTTDAGKTWHRGTVLAAPPSIRANKAAEALRQSTAQTASLSFIRAANAATPPPAESGKHPLVPALSSAVKKASAPAAIRQESSVPEVAPAATKQSSAQSPVQPIVAAPVPTAVTLPLLDLADVKFLSPKLGIAVGARGTILRTEDGGSTWYPVKAPTGVDLLGVTVVSSGRVVAVGRSE